jgi:hypothetical protein
MEENCYSMWRIFKFWLRENFGGKKNLRSRIWNYEQFC